MTIGVAPREVTASISVGLKVVFSKSWNPPHDGRRIADHAGELVDLGRVLRRPG